MDEGKNIKIKVWNSDFSRMEESGEIISTYTVAKSMTIENFAAMLDEFLNLGGKDFREGKAVGLLMRHSHRTLQRLVICFAFGLVAGLAEQEYTDARNETAIQTAKKIAQQIEEGDLPLGLYI